MVKINKQGLDSVYKEIARKAEQVDRQIRSSHTGKPANEIEPVARRAFQAIGVNFKPGGLDDYAKSVEEDKDFKLTIR